VLVVEPRDQLAIALPSESGILAGQLPAFLSLDDENESARPIRLWQGSRG